MLRLLFLLLIPVAVMASEPYASTYVPLASDDLLIVNATVLTGTGERLTDVDVHLSSGRIEAIGSGLSRDGVRVLDAEGQFLTPGIIDVHSHLGVSPSPSIASTSDVGHLGLQTNFPSSACASIALRSAVL